MIKPLVWLALWVPIGVCAQVPPSPTREIPLAQQEAQRAQEWGLSLEEWTRYQQLREGPLGIHSPHLDPLTALGIEARSESERIRYAEMQVRVEFRRVERLLAYQRAYDAAWQRLFPSLERVHSTPGRLEVFVKPDCSACETRVRQLQASGAEFDLYMLGPPNDSALRRWAKQVGIDPAKVRARTITLNHDAGRWATLGLPGTVPAVVRQVNGSWQRQ